jgi:hypothetical protein
VSTVTGDASKAAISAHAKLASLERKLAKAALRAAS